MSETPFMQFYWNDYFGKTAGLTCEQHGAYLQIIGKMWTMGGSLPADPDKLARIVGLTRSRWIKIAPAIMAYFEVGESHITHARITEDLEKAREKSSKRADAGKRGGDAKALKNKRATLAKAVALPCHSSEPESEREDISEAKASSSTNAFEPAWKSYPHVRGRSSKPKSIGYWKKLTAAEREGLAEACEAYRRDGREPNDTCGAPAMERWLRDRKFADWLPGVAAIDHQPTGPPRPPHPNGSFSPNHERPANGRQSPGLEKLQAIDAAMAEAVRRRLVCADSG